LIRGAHLCRWSVVSWIQTNIRRGCWLTVALLARRGLPLIHMPNASEPSCTMRAWDAALWDCQGDCSRQQLAESHVKFTWL
jgi:hypothetical protein